MKHGLTALHKAAVTGQLACLRTLLEYNASVAKTTPDGLTAVHLAAWKGQHEAIRLLASRQADLNAKSQDGGTPLHEAVRSGDNTTVHLLLQLGAKAGVEDKVCSRSFWFLQKATMNFLQLPASYLAAVRYCVMAGYCASDEIALGSAIIPCSALGCPYFLKGRPGAYRDTRKWCINLSMCAAQTYTYHFGVGQQYSSTGCPTLRCLTQPQPTQHKIRS
jgi:ankyrin repeat protein